MSIQDYLHPAPTGITGYSLRPEVGGIRALAKSRSKKEWHAVTEDKTDRYGSDETFADPAHHSYPLTQNGKPSRERTLAAWRYINTRKNGGEYTAAERARVKARIRHFAKTHWDLDLAS